MTTTVTVTAQAFAAAMADIDERIQNIVTQITLLDTKYNEVLDTQTVVDFPDTAAQIREQWLTAFQEEVSSLLGNFNTLTSDVATLKTQMAEVRTALGLS